VLISVSLAFCYIDTLVRCETTDTGLVHRTVCLFTSQLSLHGTHCAYPRSDGLDQAAMTPLFSVSKCYSLVRAFVTYAQLLLNDSIIV